MDFAILAQQCAPQVHADTIARIVKVESAYNPYAIGVVAARLTEQPRSLAQALATAKMLQSQGYNFSVGLAQINRVNLTRFGLTLAQGFEPCTNLRAANTVLTGCFASARRAGFHDQQALGAALSCYYSGNFVTGYRHGYVQRVVGAAAGTPALRGASTAPLRTPEPAPVGISSHASALIF